MCRNLSFLYSGFLFKELEIFQLKRILQHTRLKEKRDGRKNRTKNNWLENLNIRSEKYFSRYLSTREYETMGAKRDKKI